MRVWQSVVKVWENLLDFPTMPPNESYQFLYVSVILGRSFCLFSELKVFPVHWVVNQNRHIYNDKK